MADEADITGERAEFVHLGNLAKSRKPEGPAPTGFCLNCGEALPPFQRWCDHDCYSDWSRRKKMSLLSYTELCELVEQGVLSDVKPECINAASIDVHLGDEILAEAYGDHRLQIVDLSVKPRQSVQRDTFNIRGSYHDMLPLTGILAHTVEKFYLPNTIVAEYYLNSSLARNHLEHLHAGHCDPGWNDSSLTLELFNMNRFHTLRLRPGQRIGQILLYRVAEVPTDRSYATIGNYNGDAGVGRVKGR